MKVLARGVLAALVWLAVLPAVAGAHATIVRVTPADRSVVAKQPAEVTIRWSEPVDLGPDSVRLLDATGGSIDTAKAAHRGSDRATAVLKLPAGLKDGTYVVAWRVTSADSHPVSGAFSFSVGAAVGARDRRRPGRVERDRQGGRRRSPAGCPSPASRWRSAARACCCSWRAR